MTIKKIVQICALSVVLVAGGAAAQTAGSVNVSTTPFTGSVSQGAGVNFGSITLSGVNGGATVTSLPITITPANGGVAANVSNCQVFNAQGNSLTTGTNVVNTIGTGASTFTFNSPIAVNGNTGNAVLNVRCDVASTTPVGAIFTISTGMANLAGTTTTTPTTPVATTTPTGPVFRINLDTAPSVPAGAQDVTLANISLGATGANFNIS